jgi:AraC family transcriptional regulator
MKLARVENYPHVHRAENCPCLDTSGTVVATRRVPGFQVVENHYPAGLELTSHRHEHAYLSYVLEGPYAETYGNSTNTVTCAPRVLRYLPPEQIHANVFDEGSHCLIVEVETEALRRVEEHTKALERPGEIQGIASTWLAQRLYHEFRQGDGLALVSLEGILLEMLAEGARHSGAERIATIPRWLHIARDYLDANFLRQVSLGEIAGAAGVHRVHLSREFRRYFSTTVGEYLRRKRIEHACRLVSTTQITLAEIAMTCGFSDQSHFSATFRRQIGITPARYRQSAQTR